MLVIETTTFQLPYLSQWSYKIMLSNWSVLLFLLTGMTCYSSTTKIHCPQYKFFQKDLYNIRKSTDFKISTTLLMQVKQTVESCITKMSNSWKSTEIVYLCAPYLFTKYAFMWMYHSCLFINFFKQKSVNLVAYSLSFVCVFEGPYNTVTWLSTFSLTLFLVLITHCTILRHLN